MPQTTIHVFRLANREIPLKDWLDGLAETEPMAYAKCLQRILLLSQFGHELRRPIADLLRDGIHELRAKHGTVNYRILYFFDGRNSACLSHGITKECKVDDHEIDLAVKRKKLVEQDPEKYTADFDMGD